MSEDKKIFASPKVRKFARELGANVSQIKGTERKGRITEEDIKNFTSSSVIRPFLSVPLIWETFAPSSLTNFLTFGLANIFLSSGIYLL